MLTKGKGAETSEPFQHASAGYKWGTTQFLPVHEPSNHTK